MGQKLSLLVQFQLLTASELATGGGQLQYSSFPAPLPTSSLFSTTANAEFLRSLWRSVVLLQEGDMQPGMVHAPLRFQHSGQEDDEC